MAAPDPDTYRLPGLFLRLVPVCGLGHLDVAPGRLSGFGATRTGPIGDALDRARHRLRVQTGGLGLDHHRHHLSVWPRVLQLDLSLRHTAPVHRLAVRQSDRGYAHRTEPLSPSAVSQVLHSDRVPADVGYGRAADRAARSDRDDVPGHGHLFLADTRYGARPGRRRQRGPGRRWRMARYPEIRTGRGTPDLCRVFLDRRDLSVLRSDESVETAFFLPLPLSVGCIARRYRQQERVSHQSHRRQVYGLRPVPAAL